MQVEAQIAHAARKRDNAIKSSEQINRDVEKQTLKLQGLRRDLVNVQKAAEEAQGKFLHLFRISQSNP